MVQSSKDKFKIPISIIGIVDDRIGYTPSLVPVAGLF